MRAMKRRIALVALLILSAATAAAGAKRIGGIVRLIDENSKRIGDPIPGEMRIEIYTADDHFFCSNTPVSTRTHDLLVGEIPDQCASRSLVAEMTMFPDLGWQQLPFPSIPTCTVDSCSVTVTVVRNLLPAVRAKLLGQGAAELKKGNRVLALYYLREASVGSSTDYAAKSAELLSTTDDYVCPPGTNCRPVWPGETEKSAH
jgi:hypothetical protein